MLISISKGMCLKVKYERENAVKRKMKDLELWGFGSKSLDKLQCDLNKNYFQASTVFYMRSLAGT